MSESEISSLKTYMQEAIREVLETILSTSAEFIDLDEPTKGMSAIIGISDGMSGYLAIHVSSEDACKIAGTMLGDSYTEVNDVVCDAIGEVANMMGGSLKKFAGRYSEPFKISTPTIVCGNEYEVYTSKDAVKILLGVKALSVCFKMQLVVKP